MNSTCSRESAGRAQGERKRSEKGERKGRGVSADGERSECGRGEE
jgi:hypothetical protein